MTTIALILGIVLNINNNPLALQSGMFGNVYLTEFNAEEFRNLKGLGYRESFINYDSSTIILTHLEGLHGAKTKFEFLPLIGFGQLCKPSEKEEILGYYYSISKSNSLEVYIKTMVFDLQSESQSQLVKGLKDFWHSQRGDETKRYLVISGINIVLENDWVFYISIQDNTQSFEIMQKLRKSAKLKNSIIIKI